MNNVYEDNGEDSAINQKFSKKHPLNVSMADEFLIVSNPRLVDVDWRILQTISSKNLNKILQPRFQITLTMLTQQGDSVQSGCSSLIEWSAKRNQLKLRRLQFECDQTELTHLLQKVKSATNSVEQLNKVKSTKTK